MREEVHVRQVIAVRSNRASAFRTEPAIMLLGRQAVVAQREGLFPVEQFIDLRAPGIGRPRSLHDPSDYAVDSDHQNCQKNQAQKFRLALGTYHATETAPISLDEQSKCPQAAGKAIHLVLGNPSLPYREASGFPADTSFNAQSASDLFGVPGNGGNLTWPCALARTSPGSASSH